MLVKTLESKLDDYFAIIPKELFEEADKIYEKRKEYLHDELESWL